MEESKAKQGHNNIAIETALNHGNGWASGPKYTGLQKTVRVEPEMVFATNTHCQSNLWIFRVHVCTIHFGQRNLQTY